MELEGLQAGVDDLWSDDPERRLAAAEQIRRVPRLLAEALVGALAGPPDGRYIVFERLGAFGTLPIVPLKRLLDHDDAEARLLAACALLWLGDSTGESIAVKGAGEPGPNRVVAIRALDHANSSEIGPLVQQTIRDTPDSQSAYLDNLVTILERRRLPLDADVRERLATAHVAEYYRIRWLNLENRSGE